MIWIVDASVALRWLLKGESHPHADAVLERVVSEPGSFAVPELFAFEVYSVLCRLHPRPLDAFLQGVIPILQGGVHRHPITETLARKAHPFVEAGLTGYDATYAALAVELEGKWLTFDEKAHRRLEESGISILLSEALPDDF